MIQKNRHKITFKIKKNINFALYFFVTISTLKVYESRILRVCDSREVKFKTWHRTYSFAHVRSLHCIINILVTSQYYYVFVIDSWHNINYLFYWRCSSDINDVVNAKSSFQFVWKLFITQTFSFANAKTRLIE